MSRSLNCAVLALALVAGGCDRQTAGTSQPEAIPGAINRSHHGSLMPAATLRDAGGDEAQLAAFKGHPLLVNLWATWCAPCVAELPQLDRIAAEKRGGLMVAAASQDLDNTAKIDAFFKDHGIATLHPWLDPDGALAEHFEAQTLPVSVLYDSAGREVWRTSGGRDWTSKESAALLAEAK